MVKLRMKTPFQILKDNMVIIGKRMYLPSDNALKKKILKQIHESKFVVHPRSTRMYKHLKEFYWWLNMKKEIANHVAQCVICQQVKMEYQKLVGPLQLVTTSIFGTMILVSHEKNNTSYFYNLLSHETHKKQVIFFLHILKYSYKHC